VRRDFSGRFEAWAVTQHGVSFRYVFRAVPMAVEIPDDKVLLRSSQRRYAWPKSTAQFLIIVDTLARKFWRLGDENKQAGHEFFLSEGVMNYARRFPGANSGLWCIIRARDEAKGARGKVPGFCLEPLTTVMSMQLGEKVVRGL